jgi:RND family efflux transporter MFP subunit
MNVIPFLPARLSWSAAFTCAMVMLAGCGERKVAAPPAIPPARIFTLPSSNETRFRAFPGEVKARDTVPLSFDVSGRLVDFPVYDGQVVEPGHLIGRLQQDDFKATLDTARAQFEAARTERERSRTLLANRAVSQRQFEQMQEAFDVAEATLRTAQKAFDDTTLMAPFKGRVSRRFVRSFQNVRAKEPIVLLQNVAELDIDIQIPETAMASVNRDITADEAHRLVEARAEFAAIPGEYFDLALRSFATQANPSSRTFLVTFSLKPPENRNILPGMTSAVQVRLRSQADEPPLTQPGVFEIPARAVLTAEGKAWVWRWNPATRDVARVPVDLLDLVGESVRVRSAELAPGESIVASGVRFLSTGDKVQPLAERQP